VIKIHLTEPYTIKRLKHPEYNITKFLLDFKVPFQVVRTNPDWVVVHVLWGNQLLGDSFDTKRAFPVDLFPNLDLKELQTKKQMEKTLNSDGFQKLHKDPGQPSTGIIFWYPHETEHYGNPSVTRMIEMIMEKLPKDIKVIYVTGNLRTDAFEAKHQMVASCEKAFYKKIKKAKQVEAEEKTDKARQEAEAIWNQQKFNPFMTWMRKHYPDWADDVCALTLENIIENTPQLPEGYKRSTLADDLLKIAIKDSNMQIVKVPLMFFDWQLYNHLVRVQETDQIIRDHWYKWDKTRDFMCLNGRAKDHRRYIVQEMIKQGLQDKGAISYVCADGHDPQQAPIILDQSQHQVRRNDRWMNPELYNDCWINIATESMPHIENDLFITEKTFKPMLQLQPFMVQGNKGTLEYLKYKGYRTFEKLWSEKYDQMDTWQERTDAILANLRQWCSLTLEEKQAKIKLVWEDLLHNQQMVSNTQSDETRSEYLADIVKAMSSGG